MGKQYSIGRHDDGLTDKERDAVRMLGEGKSFRTMAREAGGTHQRWHELAQSAVKKGVIAKTADGKYVAVTPLETSTVFRRLQAESARKTTTTQPEENPSDHEATSSPF